MTEAASARPRSERIVWSDLAQTLANLAAPAGVVVGLLYYFGWVRTKATYDYFGIDQDLLGLSTADYLLRSAGAAYQPAATILLVAGAALLFHASLSQALAVWPDVSVLAVRIGIAVVSAVALLCGVIGLTGRLTLSSSQLFNPLALAAGAAGLDYAIAGRLAGERGRGDDVPGVRLVGRLVPAGLVVVAAFWAVALFADEAGRDVAESLDKDKATRPAAIIYTAQSLQVNDFGVRLDALPAGDDGAPRFRYTGYRLLVHSGGRYFLLPEGWSRDNGSAVLVLPDDPARVRVDFQPAR